MSEESSNILFNDKNNCPNEAELSASLGNFYFYWNEIKNYVLSKDKPFFEEWKYPGKNYGWSYRIKDKKRVIIYLTPRDSYFSIAFVFGEKAYNYILQTNISQRIKDMLTSAKVYVEGRGIMLDIKKNDDILDVLKLIDIKIMF